MPLLLLSDAWQEGGLSWFDVAPLSTDVENATPLDLLIPKSETALESSWRALLRHQTVAERSALDTRVGQLTRDGKSMVQEVLAGRSSAAHFGSADASQLGDAAADQLESLMRLLGQSYALLQEPDQATQSLSRVLSFTMHPLPRPVARVGPLSLAAESAAVEKAFHWTVEIAERGHLAGRLDYRASADELLFVVEEAASVHGGPEVRAWIVAWSSQRAEPVTSEPFLPAVGAEVSLGRDKGIFPREVTRVELRLADET